LRAIPWLPAMSRTKDATSKKRRLADVDQGETVLHPRKARIVPNNCEEDSAIKTLAAGTALENTVVDDDFKARCKLTGEEKVKRQWRPDISRKVESLPEELLPLKGAKEEHSGEQNPKIEPKDKAALRQAKSQRRSQKKKILDLTDTAPATDIPATTEPAVPTTDDQEQQNEVTVPEESSSTNPSKPEPKQRFIVFIGNLPYTATTTSIQSHFSKLQPFTVRHSTNKATGRSRGFAFLEFEGYDNMKTCLKLYHHSLFDAGITRTAPGTGGGRKSQARKINVELTAGGGGGKSVARKERIRGKNEKLEGERERARVHREKEEAAVARKKKKAGGKTGANAVEVTNGDAGHEENIHPSRRKRMKTQT